MDIEELIKKERLIALILEDVDEDMSAVISDEYAPERDTLYDMTVNQLTRIALDRELI